MANDSLPVGLADLTKLLDGFVERIEHHEDLEVRYITWLTSIIGALIAAAATLLSWSMPQPNIAPSSLHLFVAGLCGVGAIVSVVGIFIHRSLMAYIDGLITRRKSIEDAVKASLGSISASWKDFPSKKLRLKIQTMFGLFATICAALASYALLELH